MCERHRRVSLFCVCTQCSKGQGQVCSALCTDVCMSSMNEWCWLGVICEATVAPRGWTSLFCRESHGTDSSGLPQEYLNSALAKETQMPSNSRQDELKEQEELELALALSLNDQENKKPKASASSSSSASRGGSSRPPASVSESTPPSQPVYSSIAYQQVSSSGVH